MSDIRTGVPMSGATPEELALAQEIQYEKAQKLRQAEADQQHISQLLSEEKMYASYDEAYTSCWIRVGQVMAGEGWGGYFIPRVGQEVIVSFINGDPDRPIITGSVYNSGHSLPFITSATTDSRDESPGGIFNPYYTGFISQSQGRTVGHNALRFNDQFDKEEVYIHGQKDMNTVVEHNAYTHIKNNRTVHVNNCEEHQIDVNRVMQIGVNDTETIGVNRTQTIGNILNQTVQYDKIVHIHHDESTFIGNDMNITCDMNQSVHIGENRNLYISHNDTIQIDRNQSLTIGNDRTTVITNGGDSKTLSAGNLELTLLKGGRVTKFNSECGFVEDMKSVTLGSVMTNIKQGTFEVSIEEGSMELTVAEGSMVFSVEGAMGIEVGGDRSLSIEGAEEHENSGDFTHTVEGVYELNVTGELNISVEGAISIEAAAEISLTAGAAINLEAGGEVGITAGGEASVTAGGEVGVTAGGAVTHTAGGGIENTAGAATSIASSMVSIA